MNSTFISSFTDEDFGTNYLFYEEFVLLKKAVAILFRHTIDKDGMIVRGRMKAALSRGYRRP